MAKRKEKGGAGAVPKWVEAAGDAGGEPVGAEPLPACFVDPPKIEIHHGPILALYGSVLASVDWQRDVRKRRTICRDAFEIAKIAFEVFQEKLENEELT